MFSPKTLGGLVLLVLALASAAEAQRRGKAAPNDPASCPYCGGDPAVMARAGLVSHGGFAFGDGDSTDAVDALLPGTDIRWIESAHFEIGMALAPYRASQSEKKKIRAELAELAEVLPEVDPKAKLIDPWLRVHLFALRAEKAWQRMLAVLQVKESDFPDGSRPWDTTGEYMGEGPYLGQKSKYEVLILPSQSLHLAYLTSQFGLNMKLTQRWNVVSRDSISVTIHTQQEGLNRDTALHGHLVFNLTHNLLDGYKHYSYDTPIWLHEGLAHVLEREIDPAFNSFDSSEGGVAEVTRKSKWRQEIQKVVRRKEAPRMAELIALNSYAELDLDDHYTTWSMVDYLLTVNPDGFACLLRKLCTLLNEQNVPDGSNLRDHHRRLFQECLGMSYPEFDQAWADWVMGIEPEPDDELPEGPIGG